MAALAGRNSSDVQMAGGGGGGVVVHFAPVYHLDGVAGVDDLEGRLSAHDDQMRDLILEVLDGAMNDSARRAYR